MLFFFESILYNFSAARLQSKKLDSESIKKIASFDDSKRFLYFFSLFFKDFETGTAVLNLSLAIQTYYALNMTGFNGKGTVFIEGGFRKNEAYIKLLGALYPEAQISLTKMDEATAFGAAILAKAAMDKVTPEKTKSSFDIEIKNIDTPSIPLIKDYMAEFDRLI